MVRFTGLLSAFITDHPELDISAVIRGLRDANDFEFEKKQQYWNEDLGILIPTLYIICDRKLSHISSSAIRQIEKFK